MPPSPAEFAVIVPVRDGRRTVARCIDAILRAGAGVGGVRVTLVDNGSTDGTAQLVAEQFGDWVTILREPDARVGALRNVGARHAPAATYCFIDADCVIAEDWFLCTREVLSRTGAGAVGCFYTLPEAPGALERAWDRLHSPAVDGPVSMINGGNLAVRAEVFEAVRGFDESLPSGEDAEFCQRLRDHGVLVWQDRSLVAQHLGNPRSLSAFARQQYWHALGAFGTVRASSLDRPFVMTLLFAATQVAAVGAVLRHGSAGPRYLVAVLLASAAPLATVAYRAVIARRWPPLLLGAVLYWIYYAARLAALPAASRHQGGAGRPSH